MATEAVTLALDGAVDLADLASAVDNFNKLLRALATEAGVGERIGWVVSGLDYSSAVLTAAPQARDTEAENLIGGIVHEFLDVARHAWEDPASVRPAARYVRQLTELTGRSVREVRFQTAEDDVAFTSPAPRGIPAEIPKAYGSVVGRVQTLQARGTLRFTLYELVNDKAISCFLQPGSEDLMRNAWGRVVEVTGLVSRDPRTDVPRSVREVTDVRAVDVEHVLGTFLEAEGAVRPVPGAPPSEVIIRNLRDAG